MLCIFIPLFIGLAALALKPGLRGVLSNEPRFAPERWPYREATGQNDGLEKAPVGGADDDVQR